MEHKVGIQGLVVPFGYVTANDENGVARMFQQGQFIPPGWTITRADGDNDSDPSRSTSKLAMLLELPAASSKKSKAAAGGSGVEPE